MNERNLNSLSAELAKLPDITPEALDAFRLHLPKLVIFANDRFSLENKFAGESCTCRKSGLVEHFNLHFGELLLGVYEFSLYGQLADEFMLQVLALDCRGLDRSFVETVLKSWIMGIQSGLNQKYASVLVPPIHLLLGSLPVLYDSSDAAIAEPGEDVRRFMEFVLQKNRKFAAETLLALIREGKSIEDVYAEVMLPTLQHIDMRWRRNEISVADEHVATDICRYVMFRIIDSIFGERRYPFKALVTCMPGETQVLTSEIFANYLEIKGWSVYFIAGMDSADDILNAIRKNRPQVAVLSVASIACLPAMRELIDQIRGLDQQVKIAVEGKAARCAGDRLSALADCTADSFEGGHNSMLAMVMPDA